MRKPPLTGRTPRPFRAFADGHYTIQVSNPVVSIGYNRTIKRMLQSMQIGRFFSLQRGRVGQYLSPRVLVVRLPFQLIKPQEFCYFGFENITQAQKFAQRLTVSGYLFQLQKSQFITHLPYEIKLLGHTDLAKALAYWDRQDTKQFGLNSKSPVSTPKVKRETAIAA
ncbi:hypothetical protein [Phormidesmis priestleyi]